MIVYQHPENTDDKVMCWSKLQVGIRLFT